MSGQRRVGSSVGSGSKTISEAEPVTSRTKWASSSMVRSSGFPMLTGPTSEESRRASEAPDLVLDEAEAPRLAAVPVHGQGLAPQRLHDEVGDDAAVAGGQPRPVRVEDAHDAHVDAVRPVHGHGQALGEALGLVVDAARPGGVDVAPVALHLGMHLGVAVDLAGARHQEARPVLPGQLEQPAGALAAHGQGVEGPGEVRRR